MTGTPVTIVKAGTPTNIDEGDLRRGDVLIFQAGELVPADLELVEAKDLAVDEFELTGEIMPVLKSVDTGDAPTKLYRGSRIVRGTGKGTVLATGDDTEYGGILTQPWQRRRPIDLHLLDKRHFILVGMLLPALLISLSTSQDRGAILLAYLLLALIVLLLQNGELFRVALIFRELKGMEGYGIDVRDWAALEAMGEIDTICFDKTGVLTSRHLEVRHLHSEREGSHIDHASDDWEPPDLIKLACALCNDVLYPEGLDRANPIDRALVSFATDNGVDFAELLSEYEMIYEEPFESERRYMACGFRRSDGGRYYFAKGDPDVILRMCRGYVTSAGVEKPMDRDFYSYLQASSGLMDRSGGVRMALAYRLDPEPEPPATYTFLCLVQLESLLAPGVREVVEDAGKRGIRTVMLTGDRAETAARVGEETGIASAAGACLTGRMIEGMALSEVARQSTYCSVFARLLPSQKGVLIRLFQQEGHRVAMVGDGPNDGIALKVADVGISFQRNASPIATRLSGILANELRDVGRLIEAGHRFKTRARHWGWFRALMLAIAVSVPYVWVFRALV